MCIWRMSFLRARADRHVDVSFCHCKRTSCVYVMTVIFPHVDAGVGLVVAYLPAKACTKVAGCQVVFVFHFVSRAGF